MASSSRTKSIPSLRNRPGLGEEESISPHGSPPSRGLISSPTQSISFHESSAPTFQRTRSRNSIYRKGLTTQEMEPQPELESGGEDETTAMIDRERGGSKSYNTQQSATSTSNDAPSQRASVKSRKNDQMDGASDNPQAGLELQEQTFWQRLAEKYGSVELENKGSVARDHLALERTFLAWLRTSLSFASIGIAITQLFRLNTTINNSNPSKGQLRLRHVGKPLGATFLAVGILTLLIGFHRYFQSQHYVIRGQFPASRGSIIIMSFCSGALVVASLVVIVVFGSSTHTSL